MSKKFKPKKHFRLVSAKDSERLTPRDCKRLCVPLDQADIWVVVKRDPATGLAVDIMERHPPKRDADGNILLVPYSEQESE